MSVYLMCACYTSLSALSARQLLAPQDTIKRLRDVVVVGSSRPQATRQAAPLQVIDSKSIKRLGIQELSEAARLFSGVTVKDYGGIGGLKTVSIRSLGSQHTAVSYDGVAISDAQSGQVDISRFTLDNIEMVSLTTGLSDDIFQTARLFASAGALKIKTQKPLFEGDEACHVTAKLKGGSFGLINPVLSYSRRLQSRWSASVYADYLSANGQYPYTLVNGTIKTRERRMNSDIESIRLEGNAYGEFGSKGGNIETKMYAFHSERGLPGSVNFYNKKTTERLWNDSRFLQARFMNRLSELLTVQAVAKYTYAYSRYKDVSDNYAAGYQEDRNTQHEYYGSAGILIAPSSHPKGEDAIPISSDLNRIDGLSASLTTDYAFTQLRSNFLHAVQPRRSMSLTVFAMQYQVKSFTATGSLLGTYISDKVQNGDRPADRKHVSPAVAFSWRPFNNNALRVRASYKDVFRVPTFTDLYYLRFGNTSLKPEKAKQWNAGLTWSGTVDAVIRYLSITADGYYNRVEDKIVALPTMYIWRMMNFGEVEIKGADVNFSMEIPLSSSLNIVLSGNYTFQHAIDMSNPEAKNYKNQIPYTPRHAGAGSATIETPWITASYWLTAVGDRYALPQNTKTNRINPYAEQTISLNKAFEWRFLSWRLQGEIINLADVQYEVIQFYPMPGRSWRASVTIII